MMAGKASGLGGFAQITDRLYIANAKAGSDSALLSSLNITCLINASLDLRQPDSSSLQYVHVPVSDDPESRLCDYFDAVADQIQRVNEHQGCVLVYCKAGISRSATLCLSYLMKHHQSTLLEAHRWLRSRRPIVRPNSGFWRQLIDYESRLFGRNTVRMITSSLGPIPDVYESETRGLIPI